MILSERVKYIKTESEDGIITLTPIKDEGRKRNKGRVYYYVDCEGMVNCDDDNGRFDTYDYGNYYPTREAAQAVADLRKHVYKFPMCKKVEQNYFLSFSTWQWSDRGEDLIDRFAPDFIHHSSTEEDRAERLRLINAVIKHCGYLTI